MSNKGEVEVMKARKGLAALLVMIFFINVQVFPVYAESNIRVVLNGEELDFDVQPRIVNERVMVPMRGIFESLGADIEWEDNTRTMRATRADRVIVMRLDDGIMRVNQNGFELDAAPLSVYGRAMVPIRAIADGFDATVNWDPDTRTVDIVRGQTPPAVTPSGGRSLEQRLAQNPVKGMLNGYGNSRLREIQYDTRLYFEQSILPVALSDNEYVLERIIERSHVEAFERFLRSQWDLVAFYNVASDLNENSQLHDLPMWDQWNEVLNTRLPQYGLSANEHILNITIEAIPGGTNVAVIEMSEPGWYELSTYIGVLFDEDLGLGVFNLGRGLTINGAPVYMFGAMTGSDFTAVSRPTGNNRQAFLNAIADATRELRSGSAE